MKAIGEHTAMAGVKGNDDFLQAMQFAAQGFDDNGNAVVGVEGYLRSLKDKDGTNTYDDVTIRQATASINRATSIASKDEVAQFAAVERAGTGTDYASQFDEDGNVTTGGAAAMTESISKAYGNNRMAAASGLIMAREKAKQARRMDLAGSGTGGHIGMMEAMRANGYSGDYSQKNVNEELMRRAQFIQAPSAQGGGRGESTKAYAAAQKRMLNTAESELQSVVGAHGINSTQGEAAYAEYVGKLANVSGVLDAINQGSPEAQEDISKTLSQKISVRRPETGADGKPTGKFTMTRNVTVSGAFDLSKENAAWRVRKKEFLSGDEARAFGAASEASEAAAAAARPPEPQG